MKLLITPPFDSPIAPAKLAPAELASILGEHGVKVVTDPEAADFELVGTWYLQELSHYHLPCERRIVVDGEPPQPEYLLDHYTKNHWAAVFTPATLDTHDADCMAFYEPPLRKRPKRYSDGWMRSCGAKGKVCQLATYRSKPGNAEGGSFLGGTTNGHDWRFRVLCNLRVQVGLALRGKMPGSVDLYGRGWPVEVKGNTRNRLDFLYIRHEIVKRYAFDLNWENMEIPHYVSEKFWSPVRMGTLPVYWGPPDFHDMLPPDTIVDARKYLRDRGFYVADLARDLANMSFSEWYRRTSNLFDWYYALPRDSAHQSWVKAAHHLGARLAAL